MPRLRRLAMALTGGPHQADDLVQTVLERMYILWPKLDAQDPTAYARTVLVRALSTERRRSWWRRERSTAELPDNSETTQTTQFESVTSQQTLLGALRQLPKHQRDAVVLRHLEDLPIADAAQVLRCSEGNVKRNTHDGLKALRNILGDSIVRTES
jgi:RNA polymerase sigma factor (sigma-70 family)